MNDFTHFRKFLAKRYGLYFPCVFEFAICRSWRLWRGLYSRVIYSIVSHKRTTMATWRHRWGALYVVDCLLVIMAKPDTWKPLFVEKAPWELNQWKLTWGYMWCLSKTKCKFMSGCYWLHFRKTNSTNRSTRTFVISMRSLVTTRKKSAWLQFDTERESWYSHPVSLIYFISKDLSNYAKGT